MLTNRDPFVPICATEGCPGAPLAPDVLCEQCHDRERLGTLTAEEQRRAFERRVGMRRRDGVGRPTPNGPDASVKERS